MTTCKHENCNRYTGDDTDMCSLCYLNSDDCERALLTAERDNYALAADIWQDCNDMMALIETEAKLNAL